ncbi:MAG: hypothetical protein H0Z33_14860 [Bacillaceae bacterium]|nr:hypothetical protein [Bacillaceae bacterium]
MDRSIAEQIHSLYQKKWELLESIEHRLKQQNQHADLDIYQKTQHDMKQFSQLDQPIHTLIQLDTEQQCRPLVEKWNHKIENKLQELNQLNEQNLKQMKQKFDGTLHEIKSFRKMRQGIQKYASMGLENQTPNPYYFDDKR